MAAGTDGQLLKTQGAAANPVWATVAGTGDVVGPAGATDNAIARYDATTGKLIQNSGGTIDDSDNVAGATSVQVDGKPAVPSASATQQMMDSGTSGALVDGGATATVTVSFAATFGIAPVVVITPNSSDNFTSNTTWPYISATSTTQFTITADDAYTGATFHWIAMGAK